MNPNARSFAFNPNAGGFVPPQVAAQQAAQQQQGAQGQPQQGYPQPGAGAYYQQGFGGAGGAGGAGGYPQYGGYQQGGFQQQGYQQGGYYQQAYPQQQQQGGYQGAGFQGFQPQQAQSNIPPPPQPRAPIPGPGGLPPKPNASNNAAAGGSEPARKPVSMSIGGGSSAGANKPATGDAPRKPVSISLGGASKPAAPPAAAPADKKPVSISIGGGAATAPAKKAEAAAAAAAAPAPEESAKPAAGGVAAVKAEAAASSGATSPAPSSGPSSAPGSRPESPAPAAASSAAASPAAKVPASASTTKKAAGGRDAKGSEKSKTDSDKILAEAQKLTDAETLKDLFGENSENLKSHLNVVFIGHVDAGKSTMGGQILHLTGMVDKRTLEKFERDAKEAGRESWYLSWALDSTPQEREKGKTVEVGRAYFETGKRRYTILDAPGHKSYVPNMISGAAQADVGILVISARRGEFETGFEKGGQTREHAMLVKTAGVQKLIVVVNKMDEPTVQWDKARFDDIVGKLTPFLRAAGFNPKTDLSFIPVSAYAGQNLKDPLPKGVADWWKGPTLLSFLDDLELGDRHISQPLKMPISEKYNDMGTFVVGKLESGKVRKGDSLLLMPNGTNVEVLAIVNELEEEVPAAISGDNVRIKIRGVDHEDVSVGFVLTDPKDPVSTCTQFEAQLAILDAKNIICAGYSCVMHVHTLAEEVNLKSLIAYYDKQGRRSKKAPQFAKKGMKVLALIETTAPVCVARYKDLPQMGRLTLRSEGQTISIGKITKLLNKGSEEVPDVSKLNIDGAAGAA